MAYGNDNLLFVRGYQFITTGGTSEQITLDKNTTALTLYAETEGVYVNIGLNPTAAAPGAEKTETESFLVHADSYFDVAVPVGSDSTPQKLAAIQSGTGGTLHIYQRRDT